MHTTKRSAFTMIELVFVIVVLGILAALAMSRIDRDFRQEAADNILSAIRYTQHLALMDDKHLNNDPHWQQRWWKIMFNTCNDGTLFYRIGSDNNMDGNGMFALNEAALDPANNKPMFMANNGNCDAANVSPNILIGRKYGAHLLNNTCNPPGVTSHIGFDHLGRPHQGYGASNQPDHASYLPNSCRFTFVVSNQDQFTIEIAQETGYACVIDPATNLCSAQ